MILRGENGTFSMWLFSVKPSHPLLQIPLRTRCRCLANLVTPGDEDIFREGTDVVGFKQKDVVTQVEEGPILAFFFELLLEERHLVMGGDGENLNGVLPLVVETPKFSKLMLADRRLPINKLQ